MKLPGTTRTRPNARRSQPRSRATIAGTTRTFRDIDISIACRSVTVVFTSTRSSARSIRLPRQDVDGAAIAELVEGELELDRPTRLGAGQPRPARRSRRGPDREAGRSRRRASGPPRPARSRGASTSRRAVRKETSSRRPASRSVSTDRWIPIGAATSSWRSRSRRRTARTTLPTRRSLIAHDRGGSRFTRDHRRLALTEAVSRGYVPIAKIAEWTSSPACRGRVLDLAFPAVCPGCRREGPPICDRCLPALDARLEQAAGVPIGLPSEVPPPLLQLEWCAPFGGVVRRALHQLKYGGETRLARPLGEAVARRWRRAGAGGDLLVPVPVHAERRRRRGYDQAELIAAVAADALGLPMAPLLRRERPTIAQFDLDRRRRATNVAGAFGLAPAAGSRDARRRTAAAARRPLDRPRGRRRHDRRDAGRVRRAAARARRDRRLRGDGGARALTRRRGGRPRRAATGRPGCPPRRSRLDPGVDSNLDGEPADRPRTARCPRERGRQASREVTVRTIVKGKNLDVPDNVRAYTERKLVAPGADPRRPERGAGRALDRAAPEPGRLPHRRGHAGHRRPHDPDPRGRADPSRGRRRGRRQARAPRGRPSREAPGPGPARRGEDHPPQPRRRDRRDRPASGGS